MFVEVCGGKLLRMKLIACLLLLSSAAFAATHAPLPEQITGAKSVYILNESGRQSIADGAYEELTKWGRFTVSSTRNGADLVLRFTHSQSLVDGTTVDAVGMMVLAPNSEDSLFQDNPKGIHLSWATVGKVCIKDFKKRIEEK